MINKPISFFLNGEEFFLTSPVTILNIIKYFNYNESLLILEYNYSICHKKLWKNIFIQNKDKIEIVTIVGGG